MMRKLAGVADYLNDSHRTHIEKMAGDAGFTVDYFTEGHLPQDRAGEYEVIYGTVPPKELKAATALRWFCCSYAGMDQWKDDALYHSPEVMLSNSSGAYGVTISEHMVMVTLMLLRQMPTVQEWMRRHDWSNEKPPMRSVCGSRITVLGTGDIGTSFARRVKAMGAKTVVGVSRSGRHVDDAYDAMYTTAQLDQVLPETEILAMALPGTAETEGILSRSRIALLPKEAVVVNVGRGTAIDADDLIVQRRALLVALVVHCPVGVDAEAGRLLGCVDVGAQEQKLPAVFFLLTLDHAPHRLVVIAAAGVFVAVGGDDEQGLFRHILPAGVLVDVPDVVDGPAYGVQQRRAAPGEILLLRHERHLGKGQAVVDDHALIVKQHGGDQGLARLLFLPRDHGVEAADGVRLQPGHRTAAIQNKNQFRHKKALLRLITLPL